jgi:heme-degrading monooxygenase HmoA
MQFLVTEMRKTEKGEQFIVETRWESESKDTLKKHLDESKPAVVQDKNYRIKEIFTFERIHESV